jgi:hypothetical protein
MRKFLSVLVVSLSAIPVTSSAAPDGDKAYCDELSALYRRYVQNSPGRRFDAEAAVALDDCQKGNAAASIPVLEMKLLQSGFSLPKEFKP